LVVRQVRDVAIEALVARGFSPAEAEQIIRRIESGKGGDNSEASLWVVSFGKWKGTPVENVDTGYLRWLLAQNWFLSRFAYPAEIVSEELEYRDRYGVFA